MCFFIKYMEKMFFSFLCKGRLKVKVLVLRVLALAPCCVDHMDVPRAQRSRAVFSLKLGLREAGREPRT